MAVTTPTWNKHVEGVYYGKFNVKVPFTPPTGWAFVMGAYASNGYVNGFFHNPSKEFRATTMNSAATLTALWWQLIQIS